MNQLTTTKLTEAYNALAASVGNELRLLGEIETLLRLPAKFTTPHAIMFYGQPEAVREPNVEPNPALSEPKPRRKSPVRSQIMRVIEAKGIPMAFDEIADALPEIDPATIQEVLDDNVRREKIFVKTPNDAFWSKRAPIPKDIQLVSPSHPIFADLDEEDDGPWMSDEDREAEALL